MVNGTSIPNLEMSQGDGDRAARDLPGVAMASSEPLPDGWLEDGGGSPLQFLYIKRWRRFYK